MKERSGYVFKSNGRWFARITVTDEITGKRRNIKRTADSKAEARHQLAKLKQDLNESGKLAGFAPLQMIFNDLAEYYRENHAIPPRFDGNQKIEGMRDYRRVLGFVDRFCAFFGSKKVREITHAEISAYRRRRLHTVTNRKTPRSITSVNRELSCLRRMFNVGVQNGWLNRNPFTSGEPLILTSCEKRRERILSSAEESHLLAACDDPRRSHLKALLIALLDTGARKGEMLKLVWSDVDLKGRIITIRARNTKTLRERDVAITERLCTVLRSLWEKAKGSIDALVFGIVSDVKRSFATACKIAGIKHGGLDGLTMHCLRHTAATRLVKGQLPIQLVGRILGHSQVNTTYRYLTADTETVRQAALILDRYQNAGALTAGV